MQTRQINNPKIEDFMQLFDDDGYQFITNIEVKKRIPQAIQEVKGGEALLFSQAKYEKNMNEFMNSL